MNITQKNMLLKEIEAVDIQINRCQENIQGLRQTLENLQTELSGYKFLKSQLLEGTNDLWKETK